MRAGCTFADFDGDHTLLADIDTRVSLVQCTFAGNTLFPSDLGAAVIEASGSSGSQVRLEWCTFSNNTPYTLPTLLADNRGADVVDEALFYSDSPSPSVCTYEGNLLTNPSPTCVNSSPQALEEAGEGFINITDARFLELQQV